VGEVQPTNPIFDHLDCIVVVYHPGLV
jgi:hypothetical protein